MQNVKKLLADLSAEELLLRLIVHELSAAHPGQPSGTYIELSLSGLGSGSAGAIIPGGNNCMYGENLVAGTEGDTGDFGREYVRLLSGISRQATATERLCLSPQGEFQREWR